MATITRREGKNGAVSYLIRCSVGYDVTGRQRVRSMTWRPEPKWSEAKTAKELERAAILFEEQCNSEGTVSAVKFQELGRLFFEEYAEKKLRPQSVHRLRACEERTYRALGHLRADRINLRHIQKFIDNLSEPGISRRGDSAQARPALLELMKGRTQKSLAEEIGVSQTIVSEILHGDSASYQTAEKIARALGRPVSELFTVKRANKRLAPKTIRHYLSFVSDVLDFGIRMGMVSVNPCPNVVIPTEKKAEKKILSLEEAQAFLDSLEQAPTKYRTFFTLALFSGLRRGELLGLRWSDVSFEDSTICISQSSLYLKEKGGQYIDDLKSRASYRTLKLPQEVFQILRQLRAEQTEDRVKLGDRWKNDGDLIFVGTEGKPLCNTAPYNWLKRFCAETGQPFVGIHGFRHTNSSLLIVAGADPATVSKSLGHSSPAVTLSIYAHSFQAEQARKSEAVGELLRSSSNKV